MFQNDECEVLEDNNDRWWSEIDVYEARWENENTFNFSTHCKKNQNLMKLTSHNKCQM